MVFPVDKEKIKEQRLKDVLEAGTGLLNPPSSTEELLGLLDKSKNLMVYMEQSNSDTTKRALLPLRNALRLPELFGASDMDVKMSVISCISEMMRITAPEPPYDDDVLTEFFELFVPSLACLSQNSTTSIYRKAALILEVAAEVRFCVLMVELKLEKLIVEMFQLFMKTIRSDHPDTVFKHMEAIMTLVIQESDDEISLELLNSLLDSVKKDTMKISPASWKLGERVLKNVADILKPSIQKAVHSSAISLGDYSETVTSMCENGSTAKEDHICGSGEHVVNHTDPAEKSRGAQADEKITENKTDQPSLETRENESKLESRTNQDEVAEISTLNDSASTEIRQAAEVITKSATVNGTTSPNRNGETILIENTVEQLGPCQLSESIKSVPVHDDPETDELDPTKSLKQESNANIPKKRDWKPNTRMLPDEGYSHYWDPTNSSEKIKDQAIEPLGSSPKVSEIGGSPDGSRRKRGRPKKNKITLDEDGNINSSPVPNVDFHEAPVKEKTQVSVDVSVKKEPDETSYLEEKQDYLTGKQEKDSAGGKETDSVMTDLDKQLIGKRIKVWWPLDKRFYIGVVHSFDLKKMKHKVIYLDDEEELLNLRRERWELIGDDVSLDGLQEQEANDFLETNVSSCEPKRRRRRKSESAGQAKAGSSLKRGRPPKKPKVEVDNEPISTYIDRISNGEKSIGTCSKSTVAETVVEDPQTCTGSGSQPTAPDDVIASKDEDPQKSIGTSSKPTTPDTTTVPKEREADLPKPNASSDLPQKKIRNRKTESVEQAETGSKPKKRGRPPRKNKAEVDNAPESPVTEGKGNNVKSANTISKVATPETVIASSRVEDPQKPSGTESKPTTPETPIASKTEIPQKSTGAGSKPTTRDTVIVPKEREAEADLPVASNASSYIPPKKKRNRKSMLVGEANTDSPKKRGRPPRNPKVEVDSETDNPVTDGKGNCEMTTGTGLNPTKPETVIASKSEDPQKSSDTCSKPTTPNTAIVPKEREADRPEHNTSSLTPPKKKRNRKSGPVRPDNSGTPKKRGRPPKNPKVEVDSKPEKPIGSDSKAEETVKTTVTSSKLGAPGTVVACKAECSRDESESTSSIQENASGSEEREKE